MGLNQVALHCIWQ